MYILSFKHNKEFCVIRGRVQLVFVLRSEGALGTSARQSNKESIGTSTTMCFEKTIDAPADFRFVTASVKYCITTLGWKKT